jgi:hypothetical protein
MDKMRGRWAYEFFGAAPRNEREIPDMLGISGGWRAAAG